MHGILNLHKGAGLTSHDVVAKVRRILKTKRVGHGGTLDPDATGVLVVAVGHATRLLPFLPLEPKVYVADAAFGVATTTEDASGATTNTADAGALTEDLLRDMLPRFVGEINQIPPMVSAVHHEGRRLYELAREGKEVERAARRVVIHALRLESFAAGAMASARLTIACGGGTYIRTLCKDIGAAVGLPAHMRTLVRERVGPHLLGDAHTLADLEERGASLLIPLERALPFPQVHLTDADADLVRLGRAIVASDFGNDAGMPVADGATVSLLFRERLLALACLETGTLRPFRVFAGDGYDTADPTD